MLSLPLLAGTLGLLARGVSGWPQHEDGDDAKHHPSAHAHVAAVNTTVYDVVTVLDTKTVEVTHYVPINRTVTNTVEETVTECTTTTLNYTVWVTQTAIETVHLAVTNTSTKLVTVIDTATALTTVTNTDIDSVTITNTDTNLVTITNTDTDSVTITNTETDSVTITNTATTTETVPTTTYTTRTVFSTTYDPCPKSCSISAETVNLYFWPTNRPYSYPSTYVHPSLGYTFTSPSVYMYIPTAVGINTAGQRTGPSTTAWLLPLDLYQVSTIAPAGPGGGALPTGSANFDGNITRQLTLADLGTDCPQTADPTAIATLAADPRCDPILAAPSQVRQWAWPCNACGRFGLFDPPYAVPTLTGGLVEPTVTIVTTVVSATGSEGVVVTGVPVPTVTTKETGTAVVPVVTGTGTGAGAVGTGTAAGSGQSAGGSGGNGGGGAQSSAGAGSGSSGTGVTTGNAADPGATTSVVGSGSNSVGASGTGAPPVTASGARAAACVGGGVGGTWLLLGLSTVSVVMFWL